MQEMSKKSSVFLFFLACLAAFPVTVSGAEELPNFSVGGLLFGDFYHVVSHHTEEGEGATGAVIRRGYLTFAGAPSIRARTGKQILYWNSLRPSRSAAWVQKPNGSGALIESWSRAPEATIFPTCLSTQVPGLLSLSAELNTRRLPI